MDDRKNKNKREFLFHWKGYGVYNRTWERESNLVNADEGLRLFYESRERDLS